MAPKLINKPIMSGNINKINLAKKDGGLQRITIGLTWDPVETETKSNGIFGMFKNTSKKNVDLDLSCIIYEDDQQPSAVYFGRPKAFGDAISLFSNSLRCEGDSGNEMITVDLIRLPDNVKQLVFVITSFRGQSFKKIQKAYCHIRDENGALLANFDMAGGSDKTGFIIGVVTHTGYAWELEVVGDYRNGRTYEELSI
jgi:tellurium resistance protein TerZ